jgi:penicillin-insensitive murein endopeptidase
MALVVFTFEDATFARARDLARRVVELACVASVALGPGGCGVRSLDRSGRNVAHRASVADPDRKETSSTGTQAAGETGRPASAAEAERHPLDLLGDEELERRLLQDRPSLGPVSLGHPDAGLLWNGVKMPEGERWTLVDPQRAWATPETVQYLIAAIDEVHEQFPGTGKLFVGDLSREGGGRFGEHISHRSGRDVDLGFYYKQRNVGWYTEATEENLDIPRTWALIRALVTETDLELILLDRSSHWALRSYARSTGEDAAWVRSLFVKSPPPEERLLIQHDDRHKCHLHVRFYNPIAQQAGYRIYPLAVKNGIFKARRYYVPGWAKRDDTFEQFLTRYRMSPSSFQSANGSRRFRPGASYKILRFGPVDPGEGPVVVPPRMLPPHET